MSMNLTLPSRTSASASLTAIVSIEALASASIFLKPCFSVMSVLPDPKAKRTAPAMRSSRDKVYARSEEHTSELQSLMRISYAVFCLKKKKTHTHTKHHTKQNI